MTGRVHDMILDPKLTGQLPEVIAEGAYYGMQTFDQHLLMHLQAGRITMEDAMRVATSPHDFKLMVAASGKLSVSNQQTSAPASGGTSAVDEIVAQVPVAAGPAPAQLAEEPAYAPVAPPAPSEVADAPRPSGYEPAPPADQAAPALPPLPPVPGAPSSPPPPSAPPPSF
jgi:twitching motility protein PilT